MLYESSSRDQKRILWVAIFLMIAVSVIVLALTLWMLYRANFEQRVADLQAMVVAQVSVIDAVARFDRQHSDDVSGASKAATLGLAKPANSCWASNAVTRSSFCRSSASPNRVQPNWFH